LSGPKQGLIAFKYVCHSEKRRALPSYHCFGLAVDINSNTNPFVGNMMPNRKTYKEKHKKDMTDEQYNKFMANRSPRIIERAMRLLHGERFVGRGTRWSGFDVGRTVPNCQGHHAL
jgi:D-alanyl-D-alanine carboxypeptidase